MGSTSVPVIDEATILGLLSALSLFVLAYVASLRLLPSSSPSSFRVLFIWHAFDALIHFIFEGSFLYNCFFIYTDGPSPTNFLNQPNRIYGSAYGNGPTSKLWQEYAKADSRWAQADLTVISLELLTVFGAGPIAAYVCKLLTKGDPSVWFWMTVLATAELYGGLLS